MEGLSYEAFGNTLYWTCNNDAKISRMNVTWPKAPMTSANQQNRSVIFNHALTEVETVVVLEKDDKPRGIVTDSCNRYVLKILF